jgi:hypothetical protein
MRLLTRGAGIGEKSMAALPSAGNHRERRPIKFIGSFGLLYQQFIVL